jgi:hypothetical protein
MPFKSDAQRKLCYLLKGKGQAGSWDCSEWSEATGGKKLPEHVEDQTEKKALGITNKLKGGVGDNKNPADLDKAELNSGIKEEKEHTNDTDVATEIAVDHLTEEPKYYSKMEKVEKKSSVQTSQPSRFAALLAKVAAVRPGLWANIRAKKRRGETTAKPGDEDYPDSKNWDKVTAIAEKQAKSAMDSVYSPQQPQQPQQQWMQQPQQQPIFVINSAPPTAPSNSALTNLGTATAIGGGTVGAGSLAANRALNATSNYVRAADPFDPSLLSRVDTFNSKFRDPTTTPRQMVLDYATHGSDLVKGPVLSRNVKGVTGTTGYDIIKQLRTSSLPMWLARQVSSEPLPDWDAGLQHHYDSFNKNPLTAYNHMGTDYLNKDELVQGLKNNLSASHNAVRNSQIQNLAADAARNEKAKLMESYKFERRFRPAAAQKVDKLVAGLRARGLLGETDNPWESRFKKLFQRRHDRVNAAKIEALKPLMDRIQSTNAKLTAAHNINVGDLVNNDFTRLTQRHGSEAAAAMHGELTNFAKTMPELAGSMGRRGLDGLSREQQLKLMDSFSKSDLGEKLTASWATPGGVANRKFMYTNLADGIAAPKRMLDSFVRNLGRYAGKAKGVGLASLPVMAGGAALSHFSGKADVANAAANSEAATQSMVDKIRKALNSNVLPALTPEATPYASLPNSGILPSLIGKPYIGKQSSDYIAALAKQAATQAGGSYLNRVVASNEQDIARMQDQAARVRAASGIPNPTGNGTHSWGGHVFPDRVENPTYNFTPPASTPPIPYTGLGSQYLNGAEGRLPYPLLRTTPTQTGQASTPRGVTPSARNPFLPDFLQSTQPGQAPTSSSVGKDKAPQLQNATGNVGNDTNQKPFSQGGFFGSNFEPQDLPVSDSAQPNPAAAEESPFANFDPSRPGYLTPEQSMLANYSSSLLNGAQDGGMGNILTAASTYDSATEKERNGKTFRRGDLQTRPGPTNVVRTNINAGTGQYDQKSDAYGNSRPSATSGSFRTATPKPANTWKPIDISGDRRRKEIELGLPPGSMNEGEEHYAKNGPRSAELAKNPKPISDTYVAPPGEDPQHTALNKAMFDIKKEQRVALASGKTWSPSGVNIINPVKPTAMAQAPAPKAPSNTYATSRFSSTPPSWATQGR